MHDMLSIVSSLDLVNVFVNLRPTPTSTQTTHTHTTQTPSNIVQCNAYQVYYINVITISRIQRFFVLESKFICVVGWTYNLKYQMKSQRNNTAVCSMPWYPLFGSAVDVYISLLLLLMMTSSNGNIFRVTGHLCGEFTGQRWIPRTKASDAELWCFLWSAPE